MHDYQYVPKRQASPIREEIENLIHLVQREVKKQVHILISVYRKCKQKHDN